MIRKLRLAMAGLVLFTGLAGAAIPAATVYAYDPLKDACGTSQNGSPSSCADTNAGDGSVDPVSVVLTRVTNILAVILGVMAVIFILVGGFNYITANGDSSSIANAKKTIIYALVGLLVAFLARPIINFVLSKAV